MVLTDHTPRDKIDAEGSDAMTIRELRTMAGMTQQSFADYFEVPLRTVEEWDRGNRKPADYLIDLMMFKLKTEGKIKAEV